MRFDFADDESVNYVPASVRWDIVVVDNVEGVGPIDPFADALGSCTDALSQTAHLVGVQSGPDGHKAWVLAELAVREVITSLIIEDRHRPHAEERLGEDVAHR